MKVLTQLDSLDNVIDGDTRKLLTKTASGGSGNVVSGVSISGDTITYTKGVSALTADSTLNAGKLDGDIADGVTAVTQVNGDNSTKIATTAYVDNALSAQPEPMVFKGTVGTGGTITTLPTDGSANVGETYKVITNGTYAGQAAKVGDTFVCERKVSAMEELFDYGYQVTNQYDASGNEQNTSRYTLEDNVISISRDKTTYGRYFLNKTNLAAGTYTFIFVPTLSGTEKKISYCVKDLDNQVEIVEQTLTIVNDEEITKQFTLSASRTVSIELQPLSSSGGTLTLSDISLTLPNGTNTWAYIPSGDEPSGTVTSVKINATGPIAIDSNAAITTSGERTISHANSGVTAGTYKSVTVNATGHVTAGSNPTTLSGYGITDAKINNGVITLGSNTITPLTAHQNAFSNVKVGSTTVAADSAGDTLELVAGSNVTLTPDATNDKVTIAATDTTYESKAAASGGTAVSLVTTGEKYTWNNKQNALSTQTAYSAKGTATKVPQITTNTLGQVTKIEEVTITQPTVNNGTLTIQKNGTNVQTFSANQSSNATANITVPTKVSELTNDSGYTTNTGTITGITMNGTSKGTSGVVDLGTVITSHQSIKTINNNTITGTGNVSVGTITKVQANGTDVASSGTANIPAASTSVYGVTELSNATDSTSEVLAATPKAVKAAYDLAASKGTGTITGVSVDGTSVATSGVANITNVPTNILTEPRFQRSTTTTNRTLFQTTRANRLVFLPADQIIVEKSTDAGTTWEDAGWSDYTKRTLFSGLNSGGGSIPLKNGVKSTDCMLRITFSAMKYNVPEGTIETEKYNYWSSTYVKSQERYCTLHTLYFWLNSNSDAIWAKLERATGASPNNWVNLFDTSSNAGRVGLAGWSGMDFITFNQGVFGGGTNQTGNYWNYRLTLRTCTATTTSDATLFDDSKLSTSSTTSAQGINAICGYGDNCWGSSSSLMTRDHLYTWDVDKNAEFPAKVTAGSFSTTGTISNRGIITNTTKLPISNGKITGLNANESRIGSDGFGMANPGTANDAGWIRMLGTNENDSVLELAVGDDGSSAAGSATNEEIVVRKYNTSNTVSKEIKLFDKNNNTSFPGSITSAGLTSTENITATGKTVTAGTFSGQLSGTIASSTTATTQSAGDNSTKVATTAYVDTAIANLPEPMIFKGSLGTGGTITSLPTAAASNEGHTYKVITAGTYASQAAKVGDTFISDGSAWVLIPSGDEPSGTVTSVKISATSPIAINSSDAITTSGERTISHANSGVTAGTYKSVTVNATGHVTAGTNPTTLSGYGITDAKIASGVITLGSNTITPLTSSSTLDATKLSGTIPSGCYTDTKYTAGTGLTLDGTQFKVTSANVSTMINLLDTGSSELTANDYVITQYVNGGTTTTSYHRRPANKVVNATLVKAALGTDGSTTTQFLSKAGSWQSVSTTDTKNTAGATDTSSKIFLIGATSQAANPQTYSDNEVYATSGVLTTKSVQVGGTAATMQYNSTDKCIEFVFA